MGRSALVNDDSLMLDKARLGLKSKFSLSNNDLPCKIFKVRAMITTGNILTN